MTITSNTENKAIVKALEWAGGREELAVFCRVTVRTVRNWERDGRVSGPSAHLLAKSVHEGRTQSVKDTYEKRLRGKIR